MNYFYFAKKSNFYAGYLNVLSGISLFLLMLLVFYYHNFVLLKGTTSTHYSSIKNFSSNDGSGSGQWFPSAFINKNGYKKFFDQNFVAFLSYWHVFIFLYVLMISSFVLKIFICIFTCLASIKAKSMIYIYLSCVVLFFPFFGGLIAIKIGKRDKKLATPKVILPGQWIRFKTKYMLQQIFKDTQTKNF